MDDSFRQDRGRVKEATFCLWRWELAQSQPLHKSQAEMTPFRLKRWIERDVCSVTVVLILLL